MALSKSIPKIYNDEEREMLRVALKAEKINFQEGVELKGNLRDNFRYSKDNTVTITMFDMVSIPHIIEDMKAAFLDYLFLRMLEHPSIMFELKRDAFNSSDYKKDLKVRKVFLKRRKFIETLGKQILGTNPMATMSRHFSAEQIEENLIPFEKVLMEEVKEDFLTSLNQNLVIPIDGIRHDQVHEKRYSMLELHVNEIVKQWVDWFNSIASEKESVQDFSLRIMQDAKGISKAQ